MTGSTTADGSGIVNQEGGLVSFGSDGRMGLMSGIRSNIQFRAQSLRAMLTGDTSVQGASPVDRRREIMRRRRELLMGNGGGERSGVDATSSSSGTISGPTSSTNAASSGDSSDSVTTMSEVDAGTRGRALDRGFKG